MRWWTSWGTAEPVVKSVHSGHGADGVGTALLGLHALGCDALLGLSQRTCVDTELVSQTLAGVDASPVAKAWSDAIMPGTDYGWLRMAGVKKQADDAAVRMVNALVSKGVAWPLALERAAAGYGLPSDRALSFAQKVATPVVNPMVVADAADEQLALYASSVCKAETDAPVAISKDDEWVEIRRGNKMYRQQVSRDAQGQFSDQEQQSEQEMDRRQQYAQAKQARSGRRLHQIRQQQRDMSATAIKRKVEADRAAAAERATQRSSAAAARAAKQTAAKPAARDTKAVRTGVTQQARDQLRSQARSQLRSSYVESARAAMIARSREAMQAVAVSSASQSAPDWLMAGVQNWPVMSDARTWHVQDTDITSALSTRPHVEMAQHGLGTNNEGVRMVPVLSVTPDGMKVLINAANAPDRDNRYIDMISLEEAAEEARASKKELYETRLVSDNTPLLQFIPGEVPLINIRLPIFAEHGQHDALNAGRTTVKRWVNDNWHETQQYEPYPFQRIYLSEETLAYNLAEVAQWYEDPDKTSLPTMVEAVEAANTYDPKTLRSMAIAYELANKSGYALTAEEMAITDNLARHMVERELLEYDGGRYSNSGLQEQLYSIVGGPLPPLGELLHSMTVPLVDHSEMVEMGLTPKERVRELVGGAMSESALDEVVPVQIHSIDDPDVFPFIYENGPTH